MKKLIHPILLFFTINCIYSNTINVPSDYSTIQSAIDTSNTGDTIIVQLGTYTENIDFKGKDIVIASMFLTTLDGDYIEQTIIDGNQNGSVVTIASSETINAKLIGFTITNGKADAGGGLYCEGSTPELRNLIIKNNEANRGYYYDVAYGGGIYCYQASPTILNVQILENNVTHNDYRSGTYGGGITLHTNSDAVMTNVSILKNSLQGGKRRGSGIYIYQSNPEIINSLIAYNDGSQGIYNLEGNPSISYSAFWVNNPGNFYGLQSEIGYNTKINSNGDSCDVYNNIVLFPYLESPDSNKYGLTVYSPCIGAGNTASTPNIDLFGNNRPTPETSNPDIGAIEHNLGNPEIYIPRIRYVPAEYSLIQSAINDCYDGDTVLISQGTYHENIDFLGKNILVASNFLFSRYGNDVKNTIIDGGQNESVIRFAKLETEAAKLVGLTLTNGKAETGGGIYCLNSSPILENLIIKENEANEGYYYDVAYGGGIYCYNASPKATNILLVENRATHDDYRSGTYGGGICLHTNSNAELTNLTICNNSVEGGVRRGSGIYVYQSNPVITNTLVAYNEGSQGVYSVEASPTLEYSAFWVNNPGEFYGMPDEIGLNIKTNANGDSCDINNNLILFPFIESPDSNKYALLDYSPCIGAGNPLTAPEIDVFGNSRPSPSNTNPDIGAIEHLASTPIDYFPRIRIVPEEYSSIQSAINASFDEDTVLVKSGTYYENINFNGKDIVLGSEFLTTGQGDYITRTIINGNQSESVVKFSTVERPTAKLIGFTLTNGKAETGGGIYCLNSSPTLENLIIKENEANEGYYYDVAYGGGIYCNNASPLIINSLIIENNATHNDYRSGTYGGGVALYSNAHAQLINVTIANNSLNGGVQRGGGVYIYQSNPIIINSIIAQNSSGYELYNLEGDPDISYTNIFNNAENLYGTSSEVGNLIQLNYRGDSTDLFNNTFENPEFVNVAWSNYKLYGFSPCIAIGNDSLKVKTDLIGQPRPNPSASLPDLGAYENKSAYPPNPELYKVEPSSGVLVMSYDTLNITAYPISSETKVILYNETNGYWQPDSVVAIDSLQIKAHLNFTDRRIGMYDVLVINENDTLRKEKAYTLFEAETPFGVWMDFEAETGSTITSGVAIPDADRIYCMLKKATHVGYSSTWSGGINIFSHDSLTVNKSRNTGDDIILTLENVESGYYPFEIYSSYGKTWNGQIKFCLEPDTIEVNQWNMGEILRPYGYDWKVFELTEDVEELFIQTEGYGLWSTIDIYYGYIGNMEEHWQFSNMGAGYQIKGTVNNLKKGKYYIKYKDSAVLWEKGGYSSDQIRTYMVYCGLKENLTEPVTYISVTKMNETTFGNCDVSIVIEGNNLDEIDAIYVKEKDGSIINAESYYIDTTDNNLNINFDFSNAQLDTCELTLISSSYDTTITRNIQVETKSESNLYVEVIGREKYRIGRNQTYIARITNKGNYTIPYAMINVQIPNNIEFTMCLKNEGDSVQRFINSAYNDSKSAWLPFYLFNLSPGISTEIEFVINSTKQIDDNINLQVLAREIDEDIFIQTQKYWAEWFRQLIISSTDNPSNLENFILSDSLWWNDYYEVLISKGIVSSSNNQKAGKTLKINDKPSTTKSELFSVAIASGFVVTAALDAFLTRGLASACYGGTLFLSETEITPQEVKSGLKHLSTDMENKRKQLFPYGSDILLPIHIQSQLPGLLLAAVITDIFINDVFSSTPEDKYGPIGASTSINDSVSYHYIDITNNQFEYKIDYWNKEDAPAPAAIVYIRDTIDTDFDLSTLHFTEIGFLKWKAKLEGGQYFNVNIDCRPDMPYIVNVEGTVDHDTREVFWVHTTLDPETMELPEDPMSGYLPPIDSTGYQIGWVNYTIESNDSLPDGTVFTNQAFVNFDGVGRWGPAPKEGPYTNIFDCTAPTSEVLSISSVSETDSVEISWTGEDSGSGVGDYTIYVSEGDEYTIWKENSSDTTAYFHGENGKTYRFYSIARDRVGNIEPDKEDYEAMVTFNITSINNPVLTDIMVTIFPNPSDCCFNVEIQNHSASTINYEVYNSTGQRIIFGKSPSNNWVIGMQGQNKGFYLVKIYLNDKVVSKKVVLR